ncbi:hypothetical protein CS022_22405 [Veronia nyctiphanis]|uniref:Endonuclease GajA/Old nuclease/RecF-like AAA domain-containing protein n=1 Tax=Veronia nyctiphanis TaxID=1278244 RepID=A0A4Q0YNT2_9GAMM|nr:AAA family ATPase [Veronia nyctiphanis]RXJ70781.1 hypothetical protein CS022_22405 [Veronia nyctiphanis]
MTSSRLKQFSISNYKSFESRQDIDLGNLNLFYGYNNTGKSSLIRIVKIIADSVKPKTQYFYTPSVLDYTSNAARGGLFKDIVRTSETKISFGLSWQNVSFEATIQQDGIDREKITKLSINEHNKKYSFRQSDTDSKLECISDNSDAITYKNLKFSNFKTLNEKLDNLSDSVFWISPTRKQPPRQFEIGLGIPLKIEHDGSGVAEIIWSLAENNSLSFNDINSWLSKACGRVINISGSTIKSGRGRRTVELNTISIENSESESPLRIPIIESGEGIAQSLPIVTICAMAANGELGEFPIIAVEQPELHLHPKASIDLANFIMLCIKKNPNITLLLETHSESFMRAIQIAILKDEIDESIVNAYWVYKDEKSSKINKLKFDEDGYIKGDIPQKVFRENIDFSREISSLRLGKI